MTYALMAILMLAILATTLWGVKYESNKDSFMSIEDSTFLRGFWCIIVILVHIPAAYQNRIQDMIGSFAYIGVTFFFMTSAYGLKYNLGHKKGYMNHFWKKRLPSILIPALIANAVQVIAYSLTDGEIKVSSFLNINDWVKVLLLYYVIFWLIYGLLSKLVGECWQDIIMCLTVLLCSLADCFTKFKITSIWIVEPLGFAYGILAANYATKIKKWIAQKWVYKSIALMEASGVIGIAYLKFKPVVFWGNYVLKIILGFAITAFIFTFIGKLKVGNRVNSFVGGISYEVYLLHGAVFIILHKIIPAINSGLFVLVSVFSTIVIAYALNTMCKAIKKGLAKIIW